MNIETNVRSSALPTRLVWLDLEMTGLDTEAHRIVEVAMIITDFSLKELATYEAAIYQPEDVLARSNVFALDAHTRSGLYSKVRSSDITDERAQTDMLEIIKAHVPVDAVFLAGNSIRVDRTFIDAQWSDLAAVLHYRMLDVSSFKLWWLGNGRPEFRKKKAHRALDDIRESIAELKYYVTEGLPRVEEK